MTIKRDHVNRKTRLIKLPIQLGNHIKVGDTIELVNVIENGILPDAKDPMPGFGQPDGSNYGDAIGDAMPPDAGFFVLDPMASKLDILVFDAMLPDASSTVHDAMAPGADNTIYDPAAIAM